VNAYPLSLDGIPPRVRTQPRWQRLLLRNLTYVSLFVMAVLLLGVLLYPFMVVNVPSGQVGVLWLRFRGGTVLDPRQLKEEGLRIKSPWNRLFLYDLRLQSTTDTFNAISKDGVSLTATINTRFRLKHDAVPQLHQSIGPNYLATMVRPEIGSRMREVIAQYTAEEVYSTARQEIQDKIRGHTESMMNRVTMERHETEDYEAYKLSLSNMLNLVDTLVLGIELPVSIVTAINRKVEQYYISEEYTFRVAREKKESERKAIEAQGIRDFQQTVTQGISDSYLRWRGIEATLQLAQSPNSKTVIIGTGKDGLPVILGNAGSTPDATTPPPIGPPGTQGTMPFVPAMPEGAPVAIMPRADDMPPAEPIWPFPVSWSEVESTFARVSALARAAALQTEGSP
jgi:regulator of protease activity HflC (stomatin/prohibitin superfamily)